MSLPVYINRDLIPDFHPNIKIVTTDNNNYYVVANTDFKKKDIIITDVCISSIRVEDPNISGAYLLGCWANELMNYTPLHDKLSNFYPRSEFNWYSLLHKLAFNNFDCEEGKRIYYFTSFFNHSCNANAVMVPISDHKHYIKATRDIKIGEQITIDYLGTDRLNRKEKLKLRYNFDCNCGYCENPQVGGKLYVSVKKCMNCHKLQPRSRCSNCGVTYYCDVNCQKTDWKRHKSVCATLKQTLTYDSSHPDIVMRV